MQRRSFDKQLLSVFTFIVGLTIVVSIAAILSNRYLVTTHRSLIQSNLPAAFLARQIADKNSYFATVAPSFTEVGNQTDLSVLTDSLLAEVSGLKADISRLADMVPGLHGPDGLASLARLESLVTALSGIAAERLRAKADVNLRQRAANAWLAELNDILMRQTDSARVQVTATIADLYDAPDGEIYDRLDHLADVDFFTYDRHYELANAVDLAGVTLLQLPALRHESDVAAARLVLQEQLEFAFSRLEYLSSSTAQARARELLNEMAAELADGGIFDIQNTRLADAHRLENLIVEMREAITGLATYTDTLLIRIQTDTRRTQARTESISRQITIGLAAILGFAVIAAIIGWQVISKRTVTRLRDVARHIAALAREDYDRKIPVTGKDEIGRMERALHILRKRAASGRKLRQELEEAVIARTYDVVTEMHAHDVARAEAETANRTKSEFLAMMSHEIRTLLNGIVGMLRLLETEVSDSEQIKRVKTARKSSEHLLTLTNDILDYASTQYHQPPLKNVHFDIRELMGQLGGYLHANAAQKNLKAVIDLAPNTPRVLYGDVAKIRQILINLLSNAAKYTNKGQVELYVDYAFDPESDRHVLSFVVTDTGIGVAPADHARIFDAYARIGEKSGNKIEGLGLGLSICRRLTEALNGGLTLESKVGKGSRFTFTVPLLEGDIAQVERTTETVPDKQLGKCVLLIEDNKVNRMVARGYLERMGCTMVEAATGQAGVKAARKQKFDLILVDIGLPDIPGSEVARRIRDESEPVPMIVTLTAYQVPDTRAKRAELNVDRVLHKPVSPRRLAEVLGAPVITAETPGADTLAALLSDIQDIGGEVTADIVDEYFSQVKTALAGMRDALRTHDMDALARHAHRLKGAASNFTLNEFCNHLGRIEEAARQGDDIAEVAHGFEQTAHRSCVTLRAAAAKAGLHLSEGTST